MWQRAQVRLQDLEGDPTWRLYNNLFYGGDLNYRAIEDDPSLSAYDNFFDRTTITRGLKTKDFAHDHNGHIQGENRLKPITVNNDVIVNSFTYVHGPLGDFYHGSTDLLDQGSRSAIAAELDAYTTQADQTPDSGTVDIGFHYYIGSAPTAFANNAYPCRNDPVNITLSGYDPDNDLLKYIVLTGTGYGPNHGTLSPSGGSSQYRTYTPDHNYEGPDSFTFKVNDGIFDSAPVTVTIQVGYQPTAYEQHVQTCRGVPIQITLQGQDGCNDSLTFSIVNGPSYGSLSAITSIDDSSASVTYTPNTPFCGPDEFSFKVNDGVRDSAPATVTVAVGGDFIYAPYQTVMAAADTPLDIHLCASDCSGNAALTFAIATEPEQGELEEGTAPGHYIYTPDQTTPPYTGPDSFTFTVSNCGFESSPGTVNVVIVPGLETLMAECRPATIILTWDASAIPATYGLTVDGFEVYRATQSGGPYTLLTPAPLPGTETTYVDATAAPSTTYYYVVKFLHNEPDCRNPGQFISYPSPFSNEKTASTCCPDPEGEFWTDDTPSAQQLAEWLSKPGDTVANATFTGAIVARGIFGNAGSTGLPFDAGIILSSGNIHNAAGPNDDFGGNKHTLHSLPGDDDLDDLLSMLESETFPELMETEDAAVLEFDLTPSTSLLEFEYVFASEEYPEWLSDLKNDAIAIFVDGQNTAWVPGVSNDVPVSVFTVNATRNSDYFQENQPTPNEVFDLQYDGFTSSALHPMLTATKTVQIGVPVHIKIVIADEDDDGYDSAIFIKARRPLCE